MIRKIVKYGDPVLEQVAEPVTEFDTDELKQIVEDMWETMYSAKGVGLAAPQIGLRKRISIVDVSAGEDETKRLVVINPTVTKREGSQIGEEGCLSIPGFREQVKRANKVVVAAQNERGEPIEVEGEELLARALEHEIDHLNGILFLNHLSMLKRDMIRRKIKKLQKSGEWD
jgi:peptide deformylase